VPDYYVTVNRPNLVAATEFEASSKAVNSPLVSGDIVYVKLLDATGSYNLVPGGVISVGGLVPQEVIGSGVVEAPLQFSVAGTKFAGAVTSGYQIPITTSRLSSGYVLVAGGAYSSATISNLAFDGQSLSVADSFAWPTDADTKVLVYGAYVGQKAAGTYTATFTVTGTIGYFTGNVVLYDGVASTAPLRAFTHTTGTGTAASINITSAATELVVGFCFGGNPMTADASQAMRWDATASWGNASWSDEVGAASVTHSYTLSPSAWWMISAGALRPM
jgi:hypothetical protein